MQEVLAILVRNAKESAEAARKTLHTVELSRPIIIRKLQEQEDGLYSTALDKYNGFLEEHIDALKSAIDYLLKLESMYQEIQESQITQTRM